MYWGYVVSKDLMYWEYLFIVLELDEYGYIFFGSVVVDWENISGFSKDGELFLVVIFIYYDFEGDKVGSVDF